MRKAKAKRIERKDKKQTARQNRRQEAQFRRIAKRDRATQARIAKRAKNPMKEEVEQETLTDRLNIAYENADEQTPLTLQQQQKATNYLKKRNRQPEDSPEYLAAQTYEEREREISQRNKSNNKAYNSLNATPSNSGTWGKDEAEDNAEIEETEPEENEAETHELIMEEEEDNFCFDGKEEDYLDPETIGIIYKTGEAAAAKYREKRFSQGKKAFGQTKKSWEAEQARKQRVGQGSEVDETVIEAAKKAAEKETKKSTIKSYSNYIWIAGISIILAGFYIYFQGKKSTK